MEQVNEYFALLWNNIYFLDNVQSKCCCMVPHHKERSREDIRSARGSETQAEASEYLLQFLTDALY